MDDKRARILDAAVKLFAKNSFAATGVRKIATEADVNISMINYYFKSKTGILLEIITTFFDKLDNALQDEKDLFDKPMKERFYLFADKIIDIVRHNQDMFKISIYENPQDIPEIMQLKIQKLENIIFRIYGVELVGKFLNQEDENLRLDFYGPLLASMLFSHFMLKPLIQEVSPYEFDEKFYKDYSKNIVDIFFSGVENSSLKNYIK